MRTLAQSGLGFAVPQGAFYALVDISSCGLDSESFAKQFLTAQRVAVAPGKTFGPTSDRFVRVSFCTGTEVLEKGLDRLLQFFKDGSRGR